MSRRAALSLLAGAAALVSRTGPSEAAFGDAANVFGRTTNKSGVQIHRASCVERIFTVIFKDLFRYRLRTIRWRRLCIAAPIQVESFQGA